MNLPRTEAHAMLVLCGLLLAAALAAPAAPGPGPVALFACAAAVHAALVGPAMGARWTPLTLLIALPALCTTSYGDTGMWAAIALVALACAAGWSAHGVGRLYLPLMLLVFFAPYALDYLVREFGAHPGPRTTAWLAISPIAAAIERAWPPPACLAAMLVWPAIALARPRGNGKTVTP